jgi:hypothetical protein
MAGIRQSGKPGSGAANNRTSEDDTARLIKRIAELEAKLYRSQLQCDAEVSPEVAGITAHVTHLVNSSAKHLSSFWNAVDRCVLFKSVVACGLGMWTVPLMRPPCTQGGSCSKGLGKATWRCSEGACRPSDTRELQARAEEIQQVRAVDQL